MLFEGEKWYKISAIFLVLSLCRSCLLVKKDRNITVVYRQQGEALLLHCLVAASCPLLDRTRCLAGELGGGGRGERGDCATCQQTDGSSDF
mmetsp:Transcript_16009/g.36562  ORF Transcript_16009/g.36562 Transcript_16009/m.36562 type:complete len:91 (-) Transcript_16009:2242-2514(-)